MTSLERVEGLHLAQHGAVVEATVDRGPDNLMSMAMCRALAGLLASPPAGAHVLHLRAAGPAFCLGRDRGGRAVDELREEAEVLLALNRLLQDGKLVTVAEVAGHAAGYGVGLAALCDISVAAPGATFRFPEVEAGLSPSVVLAWLPGLVGRSHAFRLAATGRPVDASEAQRIGLITLVAETDDLLGDTVVGEIDALVARSAVTHGHIRSFLRDTRSIEQEAVNRLAVERLVIGSLRMQERPT